MDVLALYDIHGNPDALDAVLATRAPRAPTRCWSAATRSRARSPRALLDRLAALDVPVHRVRGNGEREVAAPPAADDPSPRPRRRSGRPSWARSGRARSVRSP